MGRGGAIHHVGMMFSSIPALHQAMPLYSLTAVVTTAKLPYVIINESQ